MAPARKEWADLINALEKFLRGEISVVEISRTVAAARSVLNEDENKLFYPFVNADDDALTFPLEARARSLWSEPGLARADAEREATETFHRSNIVKASWALLRYAKEHAL